MSKLIETFQNNAAYQFKDEALLTLALTHRSLGKVNNERLEFLGDSVVNFIIGEALFLQFPEADEGQLSRLRAALVKGETLAKVAQDLKIDEILSMADCEVRAGGRARSSLLAGAMEGVIGAMFKDSDFDTCRQYVLRWFKPRLLGLSLSDQCIDAKTQLQELMQAKKLLLPKYIVADVQGKAHEQTFIVHCEVECVKEVTIGKGGSRRKAEQAAAALMLEKFKNDKK